MTRPDRSTRPGIVLAFLVAGWALLAGDPCPGQGATDQFSKILPDAERLEELKKERLRPPIEFFRSQVMPNDVLPYVKANHWSMIGLEMRANHEDYDGSLQTRPIPLINQPHEMIFRRDARLIKSQNARLTLPIFLPTIPKEVGFQLIRPEAIRQDEEWMAACRVLEPHQQMVVVLTKSVNDAYARWSSSKAVLPNAARRDDPLLLDRQRYYRLVLPLDPEKPLLSPHPLTWSTISHVIWDGLPTEALGVGQQQAMVDWLHWGGQLIIVGGAGPAFAPLREGFLQDYLPADPSGENVMRTGAELKTLSESYPPASVVQDPNDPIAQPVSPQIWRDIVRRYKAPAPIAVSPRKPLFVTALAPRPGATSIPLGGPGDPPLAVEWKVGRGRVTMLAVSLTDPDLMAWPGYDTMVRRVVLRRPEERKTAEAGTDPNGSPTPPHYEPLDGTDLTRVRYLARDLGAPNREAVDEDGKPIGKNPAEPYTFEVPVGEWLDSAALPILSRDTLEKASGIEIPGRDFVLKVILSYLLILVPLNYAICRYLIGRREWAWVVVPTLSLAFAVGVERAAAYDVGYDSSCDEIDLVETHGDYPRGHVSRFASLYSTGRVKFAISYPNDPTALALPLATGRALRGEELSQSSFQTQPIPALSGFQVQPRSLAMFRAEQLASLPGTVSLATSADGQQTIVNESGFDLEEAWVVELAPPGAPEKVRRAARLGQVANGLKVPIGELGMVEPKAPKARQQLDPEAFLNLLLDRSVAAKPEDVGELRLIAWAEKLVPGQSIEPPVDRHRGFTLIVAHLRQAPLIDPSTERYNLLAKGAETIPPVPAIPPVDPNVMIRAMMGRGRIQVAPIPTPTPTPPGAAPSTAPQPESTGPNPPSPNATESPRP